MGRDQFRTIVVVGAGVSNAACGLPLAADLAAKVRNRVLVPRHLISAELERLELVNRLRPSDFETQLLALGKFDARAVLEVLRDECDFAHYPSLTYEILAHLLKHGFLDAIVNFNFDELLDQAIDEEVGVDRHVRIVRDGDWSRKLRADESDTFRFDLPLYIKPHGTVSEPESLRFTRDAYFALPPDTAHLLRVLVQGEPVKAFFEGTRARGFSDVNARTGRTQTRRVCLLVLGHALGSFEFNKLLEKGPPSSRLYVVARGRSAQPSPREEWPRAMKAIAKDRSIAIRASDGSLDRMMKALWKAIEEASGSVDEDKRPWLRVRGIVRHSLIAHLFAPFRPGTLLRRETSRSAASRRVEERRALKNYLSDRFVVELGLAIAKAKGFVDVRELHSGRPGRFYRLLSKVARRGEYHTFAWYLQALGMERRDSSSESYWHHTVPRARSGAGGQSPERRQSDQQLTVGAAVFVKKTCPQLMKACSKLLTKHRKHKCDSGGKPLFKESLIGMFEGGEVEIAPQHPTQMNFRFVKPTIVRTVAELRRETRALLNDGKWRLLLCVAESGEWLVQPEFRHFIERPNRNIGLVNVDKVVDQRLKELKNVHVEQLPWHMHNRHMTIRLAKAGSKLKPDRAIYFERRYRSALISPVVLSKAADLEEAMNDFTLYWLKARRHRENKSEAITYTRERLKDEREAMMKILSQVRS